METKNEYEVILVNDQDIITAKKALPDDECWLDLCSPDSCKDECGVDFSG